MDIIAVYITTASLEQARNIARALLQERLIACANIIEGAESLYWWQEGIEETKEILLIAKTTSQLFERLEKQVKELHSYEVPCIVAMPIIQGNQEYCDWIRSAVKGE